MDYLSVSTKIIICIFEIYLLYDLFGFVFKTRSNNKWMQILTTSLLQVSITCINYLKIPVFNIACTILLIAVWGSILFVAPLKMSLVYSSLYCIIASVAEVIGEFLLSIMESSEDYISNDFSLSLFLILLLDKAILFVVLKIWQIVSQKYGRISRNGMLHGFFVLPISTFFVLFGIIQFDFVSEMSLWQKILLLIGCTLLLFSNVFVYHLLERFSDITERNKVIEIMNTKAAIERKHYENLEKIEQERKGYMHDMHKHLSVIARLVEDSQNDKVLEILEQLDVRMYDMEKKQYCYDQILNAILLDKCNQAADEEIELTVFIESTISMNGIEDIDKIAMIGNLLDNAIEAAKKCKNEKKIKMDVFKGSNHYLVITIWNTCLGIPVQVEGDYVTSKTDKNNHGIGIKRVRGIAEKYSGILETKIEKDLFGVELYLPIKTT